MRRAPGRTGLATTAAELDPEPTVPLRGPRGRALAPTVAAGPVGVRCTDGGAGGRAEGVHSHALTRPET